MWSIDNPNHLSEGTISTLPDFICESRHNITRAEVAHLKDSVETQIWEQAYSIPSFYNHDIPTDEYGDFNPGIGRFFQQTYTLNPEH